MVSLLATTTSISRAATPRRPGPRSLSRNRAPASQYSGREAGQVVEGQARRRGGHASAACPSSQGRVRASHGEHINDRGGSSADMASNPPRSPESGPLGPVRGGPRPAQGLLALAAHRSTRDLDKRPSAGDRAEGPRFAVQGHPWGLAEMRNMSETYEPLVSHRGNTPSHEPKLRWPKVMAVPQRGTPQERRTPHGCAMNARAKSRA